MINQQSRINFNSPFTNKMIVALPLNYGAMQYINFINNQKSNLVNLPNSPRRVNGSLYWSGTGTKNQQTVRFSYPKIPLIGTGPYTVALKALHKEHNRYTSPLYAHNTYSPNWMTNPTNLSPVGTMTIYAGSGGYIPENSNTPVATNKWNDLGWIRNSNSTSGGLFYLNGKSDGTFTHAQNITIPTTSNIGINSDAASGGFIHTGLIDFVYVWNRALSVEELSAFFENPEQIYKTENKHFIIFRTGIDNTTNAITANIISKKASISAEIISGINTVRANIKSKKASLTGSLKNLVKITANIISKKANISAEIISDVNTVRANIKSKKAKCLHYRLLCIGQSNMAGWDSSTPKNETSEPHSIMWRGTTNHWERITCPDATSGKPGSGSSMMPTLLDKLYKLTGESIGSLNAAYGGIGVVEGSSGQAGWSDIESTPWQQMIVKSQSCCSNKFDFIIHWGGESDARQSISKTAFKAGFKTMLANLRQLIGNANGYIFTVKQNFLGGSTNNEIRDAFDELEKDDPRLIVFDDAANYETFDSYVHISKENMVIVGEKAAQAVYDWAIATTKNRLITSVKSKKATISGSARVALFTSISIIPASTRVAFEKQRQFNAIARDQEGLPLLIQPEFTWSVNVGATAAINQLGLLTAGEVEEEVTVTAKVGEISGTAIVTILEKIGSSINKTAACAACAVSPFI